MKLYDSKSAPNPRRTRIFLAEKGITLPTEQVDIVTMQHKTPEYTAINPLQRMPALVLDDGTIITELIAICRYFEVLQPEPPLFGVGAKEIALVEMWNRRCEINFFSNVAAVFRHLHPAMKDIGSAAGAGLCRGHAAARDLVSRTAGQGIGQARIHRRRPLFGRRHHHAGRGRFHEAGAARHAGKPRQRETLARRGVGAAECERDVMRLTIVGSGDAFGSGGRLNTCFFLETAKAALLIDCGASALPALKGQGIEPNRIDAIILSHLHGDHFGGLPFLLLDGQFLSRREKPLLDCRAARHARAP